MPKFSYIESCRITPKKTAMNGAMSVKGLSSIIHGFSFIKSKNNRVFVLKDYGSKVK